MFILFTSTKSSPFCMTTFSASLTKLTALLPQSRDISCYVSRPILAPPPPWLQKHADLRAHDFAHCPDLWHQPRLANLTCFWNWRLCGINPAIIYKCSFHLYSKHGSFISQKICTRQDVLLNAEGQDKRDSVLLYPQTSWWDFFAIFNTWGRCTILKSPEYASRALIQYFVPAPCT